MRGWGRTLFELIALVGGKGDEIEKSVTIEGKEHLDMALSTGKGAVVSSGHVGNFPLLSYVLKKMGHNTSYIIRLPENEVMAPWLKKQVESVGVKVIPASPRVECVRKTAKALRAGELVVLQIDINTKRSSGVFVKFFGLYIPTFPGAAVFAQRTGAPLSPMFMVRDGPNRHKIIIKPPVYLPRVADRDVQVYDAIADLSSTLEDIIKQYPEEWWWLHRRFRKAVKEPPPRPDKIPADSE